MNDFIENLNYLELISKFEEEGTSLVDKTLLEMSPLDVAWAVKAVEGIEDAAAFLYAGETKFDGAISDFHTLLKTLEGVDEANDFNGGVHIFEVPQNVVILRALVQFNLERCRTPKVAWEAVKRSINFAGFRKTMRGQSFTPEKDPLAGLGELLSKAKGVQAKAYSHEDPPSYVIRTYGDGAVSYSSSAGPMRNPMDADLFYEDQAMAAVEGTPELLKEMGMSAPLPQEVVSFGQALNEYSNRTGRHEKGPAKLLSFEGFVIMAIVASIMVMCN